MVLTLLFLPLGVICWVPEQAEHSYIYNELTADHKSPTYKPKAMTYSHVQESHLSHLDAGLVTGTLAVLGTLGAARHQRVSDVVLHAAADGAAVLHLAVGVGAARRRTAHCRRRLCRGNTGRGDAELHSICVWTTE